MKHPYAPQPVAVETGPAGRPAAIQGLRVTQVKEEWLVEDGWWTRTPLRRHYFELVLDDGRNVVVYRDESGDVSRRAATPGGGARRGDADPWYLQRA